MSNFPVPVRAPDAVQSQSAPLGLPGTLLRCLSPEWSIRTRMLALAIVAALPFIGMIGYGLMAASDEALERATRQTQSVAAATVGELDAFLADTQHALEAVAYRPQIQALDGHACEPLVREFEALFPAFDSVELRDIGGRFVCTSQLYVAPGDTGDLPVSFQAGIEANAFRFADPILNPATQRWVHLASYPVRDARGTMVGLLILNGNLENVQRRIFATLPEDALVAVFNRESRYVMRSLAAKDWIGKTALDPTRFQAMLKDGYQGVDRQRGADGVVRVYAYQVVPRIGWLIVTGVTEDAVFAPARAHLVQELLVGPLALLLGIVLTFWISSSIARPIDALRATASRVAQGDSSVRADAHGPPEIVDVARQFNQMLDERDRTRRELGEAEQRLRGIVHSATDAVVIVDDLYRIVQFNSSAEAMFAVSAGDAIGRSFETLFPEGARAMLRDQIQNPDPQVLGSRFDLGQEDLFAFRTHAGAFPIEISVSQVTTGGEPLHAVIVRDVAARVEAEKRERSKRNFCAVLSCTNQAIVRLRDPVSFYQEVCRVCVEYGHVRMAFIGLIEGQRIVPVTWSGPAEEYLTDIDLVLDPSVPEGRGPIAHSVRAGTPYICNDFYADPVTVPWRMRAAKLGTRSTAALPFQRAGALVGVLCLHVAEKDFFNEELIALLVEITGDISFALDNFDRLSARLAP